MIIPKKLKKGDTIRVIAPSRSLSIVGSNIALATKRWEEAGFKVTFGKHVMDIDDFNSTSIKQRTEDLHDAFLDPGVDAIFTAIGGYNSIQLLNAINYKYIQNNPKILCGFSDITTLSNALFHKTGVVGYSGPHFSTWSMQQEFTYNYEYFVACLCNTQPYTIEPSETWSDDLWFMDQDNRNLMKNPGYWTMQSGEASGKILGGHLRCFVALHGTQFMPSLKNSILFLEEDEEINPGLFDRCLQALIYQPDFKGVQGIVFGRFQKKSGITRTLLAQIIKSKKELASIPIIANINIGHTNPICTFPIGGTAHMQCSDQSTRITVKEH